MLNIQFELFVENRLSGGFPVIAVYTVTCSKSCFTMKEQHQKGEFEESAESKDSWHWEAPQETGKSSHPAQSTVNLSSLLRAMAGQVFKYLSLLSGMRLQDKPVTHILIYHFKTLKCWCVP